jgi:hypothetical protein
MITCYDCDGEGWVDDEGDLVICDACDGYGEEVQDIDEVLDEETEKYIAKYIDKLNNYRGFVTLFRADFKNKSTRRIVYFQWRQKKWPLLSLPTIKKDIFR